ncbi:kinase-like protein [Mycena albidolilacea]|uniref:Kinase-like protein n=1 Tax=Mycena albidolilacea TaxID=1033008 RepID=A0AAD6ZJH6_9AGAR|nr:kinase-like protein [Mycena albidolilacea]
MYERLCLVSPWMENGHIAKYLDNESLDTNRCLLLVLDVALGVEFLHESGLVHGDLKPHNILITPAGRACIADFRRSSIASPGFLSFSSNHGAGTLRYAAPEFLRDRTQGSFGTDVYAFGCVCYHIFTGKVPFSEVRTERAVFLQVVDGSRPTWPASRPRTRVLDNLWDLIQGCWKQNPIERLTAQQIIQRLVGPGIQATANQSTSDWGETLTARFCRSVQMEPRLPSFSKLECMLFGEGLYGCMVY